MSTDVQPPSSPKLSFTPYTQPQVLRKTTPRGPPPAAFDTQAGHGTHGRSASFSGFVSRILPSRRQEKGHALRAGFQDGGPHDAVDLVFGLADAVPSSDVALGETGDGGLAMKVKSLSLYKVDDAEVDGVNTNSLRSETLEDFGEGTGEIRKRLRSMSIG